MSIRHHLRTLVALAAAYALALQAILLAVGPLAGGARFGALPICSGLGSAADAGHSSPAGHGQNCPGACLGCCCGTPVCPAPPMPALSYAPAPLETLAAALVPPPRLPVRADAAHRSRAPPFFA